MTLKELKNTLENANKGLSYTIYKQALLIGRALTDKKFPDSPEEANPELYPPKKRYKMPDWIKKRYYKQKGVKIDE
jgi:hypothetical protein